MFAMSAKAACFHNPRALVARCPLDSRGRWYSRFDRVIQGN